MRLRDAVNQILPNEIFKWKAKSYLYRGNSIYLIESNGSETMICLTPEIKTAAKLRKALREAVGQA
jgi:hypothetical protein